MSWQVLQIEDFAEVVGGGTPSTKKDEYWGGNIPWIGPKDLSDWKFRFINKGERDISEMGLNNSSTKLLPRNSVLVTSRAPIGYIALAQNPICTNQGFQSLVCNEEIAYPVFIFYLLKNNVDKLKAVASGATFPEISKSKMKKVQLSIPPLETQIRIADILSTYDELIENNLKRINLLEQAAQNIYKEWFVNMRFPGYEEAKFDSETGLPQGWEEKGICDFKSFKQYETKIQPFNGEKEYLATANIKGIAIQERGDSFTFENKPSRAQIQPPLNSVWFARMSNTDKVLLVTEKANNDFMISSGFAGFKAEKKEALPFLFCLINNSNFSKLKDANATGSTQVSLNNNSLKSIKVIEPTFDMIEKFGALNYDSLELIQHLFKANEKLKQARDILLPRLMNQTIEV